MNDNMIKTNYLFFIIVGKKNIIEQLVLLLNNSNNNQQFISAPILYPSSKTSIELMQKLNNIKDINLLDSDTHKPVILDDGVEYSQAYICANDNYTNEHHFLQVIIDAKNYFLLSFPKFELNEDDNPENIIEDWLKSKLKKISSSFKKTIKLITVTGIKSNILVMSGELKKI